MRTAFAAAFNEHASAGGRQHVCDRCPLYQYSCLCSEIDSKHIFVTLHRAQFNGFGSWNWLGLLKRSRNAILGGVQVFIFMLLGLHPRKIHDVVVGRINRLSPTHQEPIWNGYKVQLLPCSF